MLCWKGRFTIIALPQVVNANTNPNAFALLSRDIDRLCRCFAGWGVEADPLRIAGDLWERFMRAEL